MKNIIICADHAIGYNVLSYIINHKSKYFNILTIYTTKTNDNGFWKSIKDISNLNISVKYFNNNKQFFNEIKRENIDYIFLISWKYLLSEEIILKVKKGIINLHYSLLPNYRGVYPVNNAIINGEKITGITYHWIDKNIDTGSKIIQSSLKIDINDTSSTLIKKLDKLALKAFKKIWLNKIKLKKKKDVSMIVHSNYFSRKYYESTNELYLSKKYTAKKLFNLFRGKTFKNKSSLYFKDKEGKKIFISIKLKKEKEL